MTVTETPYKSQTIGIEKKKKMVRKGKKKIQRGKKAGKKFVAGGKDDQSKKQPLLPTFLNFLSRPLVFRVLYFLTEEERITLGKAYIRFQVKQSITSTDKNNTEKTKMPMENKHPKVPFELILPEDPHTLLARLNSKRLHRRLSHLRKNHPEFDKKKAYDLNKTTEQIAISEFQGLMTNYKNKMLQTSKRDVTENEEKKEEKQEASQRISLIPSPLELLLFSPCPRAVAVLASYPRSGNSLLRTLYERTTLRVTGSDMRGGLTKHDLVGEAATESNAVQFVKTHFPERRGTPQFLVNRAVLLVRNPYDAIESYFNLMMTNTHTTSLSEEQRKKNMKVFAEMALKEIQVWRDFHEFWLQQQIPLLVIRYEDLIRHTDKVIAHVIRFVLEVKNMGFFEERIDRCIREEQIEKLGSYRPRSGGIGKSLSTGMYTPELLTQLNQGILETMIKFGYEEMMVANPKVWKLEPLDEFGVEIAGKPKTVMPINGNRLVRGPKRHTDWKSVRKDMDMENNHSSCTCFKCRQGR